MSLSKFVESLLAGGQIRVGRAANSRGQLYEPSAAERNEAQEILAAFELTYRQTLAWTPPVVSHPALLWGAMTAFRASSLLVHRDLDDDAIRQAFAAPCPEKASPTACYSVDLTLRFLPDFVRLAKAASPDDLLVDSLKSLGRQWSLSSVGIHDLKDCDPAPFVGDACLRMLYVDRIVAAKDRSRVHHPQVREAIRAAIGIHHELAAGLAIDEKLELPKPSQ